MKKTLIALAAAAATGAFAQSSVTLTGHLDVAGISNTGTISNAQLNGTSFSSSWGTSSTSNIKITATEDLGGGMKATVQYEIDPRSAFNDKFAVAHASQGNAGSSGTSYVSSTLTGFATHEMFIGLSGGFGNIQLGAPNSPSLGVNGVSSPLGTGIGSGYTNLGVANSGWTNFVQTRQTRQVKYTSPTVSGFSLSAAYAPGNDQTASTGSTTALGIPNGRAVTDVAVNYSAGNLNVAVSNVSLAAQTNATGYYALASSSFPGAATSATAWGANYKFGNITGYVGGASGTSAAGGATAVAVSGGRAAVKANMGNVDLIAQYTEVKSGSNNATKTTGLRADYNLSKTAAVYIGSEQYDSGSNTANNVTSVGLRKSF